MRSRENKGKSRLRSSQVRLEINISQVSKSSPNSFMFLSTHWPIILKKYKIRDFGQPPRMWMQETMRPHRMRQCGWNKTKQRNIQVEFQGQGTSVSDISFVTF